AQEAFGARIARLRGASGYACRNRVGSHSHADRLSEHAFANAIDISGFATTDGRTIDVAASWGPTAREEAERLAAARTKENAPAAGKTPEAGHQRDHKISAIAASDKPRLTSIQTAELQGRGASDMRADRNAPGREDAAKSPEAQFLRRLHRSACDVFGTVLGPEANAAHRDHFHLDLAHRRHSAYCQ
ncbi:MAG TPA: extensin family protein, partial [Hyphomicrobiaceae bacterium]|nr:extensin family protein [Hyphomicrobiaceae bacterium]